MRVEKNEDAWRHLPIKTLKDAIRQYRQQSDDGVLRRVEGPHGDRWGCDVLFWEEVGTRSWELVLRHGDSLHTVATGPCVNFLEAGAFLEELIDCRREAVRKRMKNSM